MRRNCLLAPALASSWAELVAGEALWRASVVSTGTSTAGTSRRRWRSVARSSRESRSTTKSIGKGEHHVHEQRRRSKRRSGTQVPTAVLQASSDSSEAVTPRVGAARGKKSRTATRRARTSLIERLRRALAKSKGKRTPLVKSFHRPIPSAVVSLAEIKRHRTTKSEAEAEVAAASRKEKKKRTSTAWNPLTSSVVDSVPTTRVEQVCTVLEDTDMGGNDMAGGRIAGIRNYWECLEWCATTGSRMNPPCVGITYVSPQHSSGDADHEGECAAKHTWGGTNGLKGCHSTQMTPACKQRLLDLVRAEQQDRFHVHGGFMQNQPMPTSPLLYPYFAPSAPVAASPIRLLAKIGQCTTTIDLAPVPLGTDSDVLIPSLEEEDFDGRAESCAQKCRDSWRNGGDDGGFQYRCNSFAISVADNLFVDNDKSGYANLKAASSSTATDGDGAPRPCCLLYSNVQYATSSNNADNRYPGWGTPTDWSSNLRFYGLLPQPLRYSIYAARGELEGCMKQLKIAATSSQPGRPLDAYGVGCVNVEVASADVDGSATFYARNHEANAHNLKLKLTAMAGVLDGTENVPGSSWASSDNQAAGNDDSFYVDVALRLNQDTDPPSVVSGQEFYSNGMVKNSMTLVNVKEKMGNTEGQVALDGMGRVHEIKVRPREDGTVLGSVLLDITPPMNFMMLPHGKFPVCEGCGTGNKYRECLGTCGKVGRCDKCNAADGSRLGACCSNHWTENPWECMRVSPVEYTLTDRFLDVGYHSCVLEPPASAPKCFKGQTEPGLNMKNDQLAQSEKCGPQSRQCETQCDIDVTDAAKGGRYCEMCNSLDGSGMGACCKLDESTNSDECRRVPRAAFQQSKYHECVIVPDKTQGETPSCGGDLDAGSSPQCGPKQLECAVLCGTKKGDLCSVCDALDDAGAVVRAGACCFKNAEGQQPACMRTPFDSFPAAGYWVCVLPPDPYELIGDGRCATTEGPGGWNTARFNVGGTADDLRVAAGSPQSCSALCDSLFYCVGFESYYTVQHGASCDILLASSCLGMEDTSWKGNLTAPYDVATGKYTFTRFPQLDPGDGSILVPEQIQEGVDDLQCYRKTPSAHRGAG